MKIIITGGAGMIGSNLAAKLLLDGHDLVIIDNLWRGSLENLQFTTGKNYNKIKFINADLGFFGEWVDALREADCVYHLADIVAGIGYVFSNEAYIFRKNLLINANVAAACEMMKVKRYVYVGTACSFPYQLQSGVNSTPLKEEQQFPAFPESAYGWSKLMGELDASYISKYTDIDTVVLVFHNVYGTPCDYSSSRAQALPAIAYRALLVSKKQEPLEVWGDGTQGRAFVHVNDIVNALVTSLHKGHNSGPIQIGPNICTPISTVAEIIREVVDLPIEIKFDPSKPIGDLGRSANYSKATKILGWEPSVDLKDGLTSLVEWIRCREF